MHVQIQCEDGNAKIKRLLIPLNETKLHKTAIRIENGIINYRIIINAGWIFIVQPLLQYLYGIYGNQGFKVYSFGYNCGFVTIWELIMDKCDK